MKTCTFFGHRDTPKEIEPNLHAILSDLIENHAVHLFYVGNQGAFDAMVRRQLMLYEKTHGIQFFVVLAYLPQNRDRVSMETHTIYPEGLEQTPPRYAINKRNLWMIKQSDYVVTYVRNITGGAAHFKQIAQAKEKTVIAL